MEKTKDRLLNVEQVRQRLNCSRSQVYNLINLGDLPSLKIGGRKGVRIKESSLEAFLKKKEWEEGLF